MNNIFEFDDGTYYYVGTQDGKLVAGGCCNWGIIPEYEIPYDESFDYDQNLETLYYEILDSKAGSL